MSLYDDYKNMKNDLLHKKRTTDLYNNMKKKYNTLYNQSNKLFEKIYNINSNPNDFLIIEKMLKMKEENSKGNITKLNADKEIGETLCNVYVKPLLKEKSNN